MRRMVPPTWFGSCVSEIAGGLFASTTAAGLYRNLSFGPPPAKPVVVPAHLIGGMYSLFEGK